MKALLSFALVAGLAGLAIGCREAPIGAGNGNVRDERNLVAKNEAGSPSPSAPARPAWEGLWEGVVGDLPVRLCLVQAEHWSFGAYYDLHSRRAIHLEQPAGQGGVWIEVDDRDPGQLRWTLTPAGDSRMTGTWGRGATTQPVRLNRVATTQGAREPCGGLAFNRPRFSPTRIVAGLRTQSGVHYTSLAVAPFPAFPGVTIQTFALDGRTAAIRRINDLLRNVLPGEPAASDWFRCLSANLNSVGADGEFLHTIEPRMIAGRWLAATERQEGWSCGGLSPAQDVVERTFDIERGMEVNLHDWLNVRAVRRTRHPGADEDSMMLKPGFRRWLIGAWGRDGDQSAAECRDVVLGAEYWNIRLTPNGLAFTPDLSRVVMACGDEFHISFVRLRPFLSAQGMAAAGSLRVAAPLARGREGARH